MATRLKSVAMLKYSDASERSAPSAETNSATTAYPNSCFGSANSNATVCGSGLSLPVKLSPEPQTVAFEFALPKQELGYAVVAEFVSADGADRSEASEYFSIATDFNRVAIFGG